MKKLFAVRALVVVCLFSALSYAVFGQVDVARKTTAVTYPLDETVTIQFRGTTRFPKMKGEAKVKRTGRSGTRIELSVDNMPRPFELGAGYATYVVWAISPTGQADNLGEIKRSGLFFINSKITVTTPLQTFALLITAEPHFMVTRPSQAIMLENISPVGANARNISTTPSINYFGNSSDYFRDPRTPEIAEVDYAKTPPAILQAKQAVALAKYAGAERDAPNELSDAVTLMQNAENAWQAGRDDDIVDITARKSIGAAVKAESLAYERKAARERRNEQSKSDSEIRAVESRYADAQEEITNLKAELAREIRNRELAERDAMNFSGQLKDLRDENRKLSEELGRVRVEAETAKARLTEIENEKKAAEEQNALQAKAAQAAADEAALIQSLKAYGSVAKNDRGIVVTLPESIWTGTRVASLAPSADGRLNTLADLLSKNPDYRIQVESYLDDGPAEQIQAVTDRRAYVIADKFASRGIPEGRIVAKGLGSTVPASTGTTAAARAKNRRVLVVLSYTAQ